MVLDEPDTHLDRAGVHALQTAVAGLKVRGGSKVTPTSRASASSEESSHQSVASCHRVVRPAGVPQMIINPNSV